MNISLNQLSPTDGLITIKVESNDYQLKVNNKLKEYAKKANIKGFRPGQVPAGVVKKMYGKSILVEEVNQYVSHAINDFIKEKKLKVLGDPLPNNEKIKPIDWDADQEFEFIFQVGMAGEFKVDLSPKVKIGKYLIEVDDKTIEETLTETRKRYSEPTSPETSETSDILYGSVVGAEPGSKESAYITIENVKASEHHRFLGLKQGDVVEFDVNEVFENEIDKANALAVAEDEVKGHDGKVSIKINFVSRAVPAEMNQLFFDKVFGKDVVTSEAGFKDEIKKTITNNYERESNHLLEHEIEHHLMDTTSIDLPDNFLKKWLKATGGTAINDDVIEKEFNDYRNSIKLDLIKNQISEDSKIVVETKEVQERAKFMVLSQFGGQAFADQLMDRMDKITENYLHGNNGQNFMKIYNAMRTEKIMEAVKSLITVQEKKVSLEEFKKHVEAHRH